MRPPIPEFTVLGGMMVDRNDIFHLLRLKRSMASFRYSTEDPAAPCVSTGCAVRAARDSSWAMRSSARLLHSLAQRENVTLLLENFGGADRA